MKKDILNLAGSIKEWLVSGDLDQDVLADDFLFSSPFWKRANRAEFIEKFLRSTVYKETALAKITKFDPIIVMTSEDMQNFNIFLTYFTRNGHSVNECVQGKVKNNKVAELISIYDLNETKQALEL